MNKMLLLNGQPNSKVTTVANKFPLALRSTDSTYGKYTHWFSITISIDIY